MGKNIGYHTRLYQDNTVKVVGGSFGGSIDMDTVERLTCLFEVEVLPSGVPVFVDREGRKVRLYLSVDAGETAKGKAALAARRAACEREERAACEREDALRGTLEDAIGKHGIDEILRRVTHGA